MTNASRRPASTVIGSMKRPLRRCSAALRPGESVRLEDDGVVGLYVQTMAPRCAPQIAVAGDLARISRRCTCGLRSTFRPRVRGQGAQEGGVRGSRRERSTYGVAGSLEGDPEGKRVGDPHGGGPALGRNAADKNLVPLGTQGPDGRGGVAQDELEVGVLLVSARSMSRNAMCSTPGGTCWRPSRHREMTAETPSGSCSSASTSPSQTPSSNGCRASAFLPVYAV